MHKVELFVTCLIDTFFPEIGMSVVELLEQYGLEVNFNDQQTCCGQPPFNAGYWNEAHRIAVHFLDTYADSDIPIIIPSGSCTAMIKHGYPELFEDEETNLARMVSITNRTYELSEFVFNKMAVSNNVELQGEKLSYHPSCHLNRILKINIEPQALLKATNAEVVNLDDECCGFGGVFSIDHPEISSEMLKRKITNIKKSNTNTVIACDVSCLMQIEGGLRAEGSEIRCSHIAQVLTGKKPGLR